MTKLLEQEPLIVMNIENSIDALRQGLLDLDCPSMKLKQHKYDGECFEGSGCIRQDRDGSLYYKIYVSKSSNSEPYRMLALASNYRPGVLLGDDDHYDLTAKTPDGMIWTATVITPRSIAGDEGRTVVISGPIIVVRGQDSHTYTNNFHRIHFFEEYALPHNQMSQTETVGGVRFVRNKSEFDIDDMNFEVRATEGTGDTVMEITSDRALPKFIHMSAQEALQFITGKSAMWRARVEVGNNISFVELTSPHRKAEGAALSPPINQASIDYLKHGWALFECFLKYVVGRKNATYWSPIAYHLYNARETSVGSIDSTAAGVSIALEAIASLAASDMPKQEKEIITKFQEHLCGYLESHESYSVYAKRIRGSLDMWFHKRPTDTLKELAKQGKAQDNYINAWSKLRNKHLHPKLTDMKVPGLADYQGISDQIRKVEVLIYQVIFHLIEYRGPYTDYGTENHPSAMYPL